MNHPTARTCAALLRVPRNTLAVALATVCVAVLTGLVVFGEVASQPGPGPALFWLDVAAGVVSCALMPALFTRWPVTAALVLALGLAAVSPAATPAATVGILQVAQHRPFKVAAWVAAAGAAAHAVRGLWRPLGGLPYGWWLLLVVAVHAALLGWGAMVRANGALIASLRERASRAEEEQARRVAEARLVERTRIAREMHDVLAHRLSLLATYAGAVEYHPAASPEQLSQAAAVIRAGAHQALEELREVVAVLRHDPGADGQAGSDQADPERVLASEAGPPQPTLEDLPRLADESRAAGTPVQLETRLPASPPVPPGTGRTAYRIAQEGLTNARKHAAGRLVQLTVSGTPGRQIVIEIRNPLPAGPSQPEPIPGSGTGLIGLSERARLADGRVKYGPTGTGEFRLQAWLPWAA
jgi:signal transduction histidine kinase